MKIGLYLEVEVEVEVLAPFFVINFPKANEGGCLQLIKIKSVVRNLVSQGQPLTRYAERGSGQTRMLSIRV